MQANTGILSDTQINWTVWFDIIESNTVLSSSVMSSEDSPRAGRPKSEEKRAAILRAATELFLARGLQNTSMDAVAASAGVSKQTVYSHFTNKDELYRAVIVHKVESYGFGAAALPENGDLEEGLLLLGRRFIRLLFDEEVLAMYRVVISESATHRKIAELFYETGHVTTLQTIERFLKAQMEQQRLGIDDFGYAARQFLSMICGHYQLCLLMNLTPELTDDMIDAHVGKSVRQFLKLYAL